MCQKKSYCSKVIDPCIHDEVKQINNDKFGRFKTLLSCCGHGKYPKSIVVRQKRSKIVFEWFSRIKLEAYYKNKKLRKRFYSQDSEGHYFLPEVVYVESFLEKKAELAG